MEEAEKPAAREQREPLLCPNCGKDTLLVRPVLRPTLALVVVVLAAVALFTSYTITRYLPIKEVEVAPYPTLPEAASHPWPVALVAILGFLPLILIVSYIFENQLRSRLALFSVRWRVECQYCNYAVTNPQRDTFRGYEFLTAPDESVAVRTLWPTLGMRARILACPRCGKDAATPYRNPTAYRLLTGLQVILLGAVSYAYLWLLLTGHGYERAVFQLLWSRTTLAYVSVLALWAATPFLLSPFSWVRCVACGYCGPAGGKKRE